MAVPIFILSNPRSGSTLLRYILDTHPEICSPAELRLGPVCEGLMHVVEFTRGEAERPHDLRGARIGYFAKIRRILDGILDQYCHDKNKLRWCEKSPYNADHIDIINAVFPDAQFICLHRHGLDAVSSFIESGISHSSISHELERHSGNLLAASMESWCRRTERLLALELTHPTRCYRAQYERLVTDPEGTLNQIYSFLNVQQVQGLHEQTFAVRHDEGPGDAKASGTNRIESTNIGRGLGLNMTTVPMPLRQWMMTLLNELGY